MSDKLTFISESAQFARLGTQMAVVLNGGALVAIPPFFELLKDETGPSLFPWIFIPGVMHAIGLLLGVTSIFTGFRHF